MRFGIGDKIFCKIRGNTIISADSDSFDIQLNFEIIGKDDKTKYLVLIPQYLSIKGSWNIKEEHLEKFKAPPSYLDCKGISLSDDRICRAQTSSFGDGMFCSHCNEFFPMSEPNQPNGTLKCYQCRINPWR